MRNGNRPLIAVVAAFAGIAGGCTADLGDGISDPGSETDVQDNRAVDGRNYVMLAKHSGLALDIVNQSPVQGAATTQAEENGEPSQQWTFRKKSDGNFEIVSVHSGLCLDVAGGSNSNGAQVIQWTCDGSSHQRWRVRGNTSSSEIIAVHSGRCLDVSGRSQEEGARVQQWRCNSNTNQRWRLEEVDGGGGGPDVPGDGGLVWRRANLTNFTSYPDPGSDECDNYNGCQWAGQFAFVDGQQSEQWVRDHNILAVHSRDANTYKLKTLRLKQGSHQIDAKVYDMCSDSDCDGCCTENARETGFLIDIESYTMERFGSGDGIVEWACLDCN